jgi:hypothetical protein
MLSVVVAVVVLGGVAALVARRLAGRAADAPDKGAAWEVPVAVDRADFVRPEVPWLVVAFTSETCLACSGTWSKTELLESDQVAVQRVDAVADKALHDRYRIDAVPTLVIVDAAGDTVRSFVGEPTATDLWAAVAEARDPGSVPASCTHD